VHSQENAIEAGDIYLLCSDGLHSVISDEQIRCILQSSHSVEDGVKTLFNAAHSAGSPDNVSCILVALKL
jgi:protein phosphatase